jgi:hypothetical protein
MNYKCSAQARLVLDQVAARCQRDTKTNNKWSGNSGSYMYIMGRENSDGKATGVVHKFQADGSHKLAGSFKILADGTITRFTGLSKSNWNEYMSKAEFDYTQTLSSGNKTALDAEKAQAKVA